MHVFLVLIKTFFCFRLCTKNTDIDFHQDLVLVKIQIVAVLEIVYDRCAYL